MALLLIMRGLWIAARRKLRPQSRDGWRISIVLFVYVFVNIGMVSGILPMVGVPLPFGRLPGGSAADYC